MSIVTMLSELPTNNSYRRIVLQRLSMHSTEVFQAEHEIFVQYPPALLILAC